jgi:hypothetical protein
MVQTGAIAFREVRLQLLLGLARLHEAEARRAAIGGCRRQLHEIDNRVQERVGDVLWKPRVVGASVAEKLGVAGLGASVKPGGPLVLRE